MAVLAQEARVIVSSNESKSQELKTKLDALTVFEKVRLRLVRSNPLPNGLMDGIH